MRSGKTTAMSGQDGLKKTVLYRVCIVACNALDISFHDGLTGVSYKLWEASVSEDRRDNSQITGALGSGA